MKVSNLIPDNSANNVFSEAIVIKCLGDEINFTVNFRLGTSLMLCVLSRSNSFYAFGGKMNSSGPVKVGLR